MSFYDPINGEPNSEQRVQGVMVGVVSDNKDPEKMGRIKVKLPIRGENFETDWVRIATLMGGNEMGSYWIPEVNDEVLVAFHLGDMRLPFVIGSLWNDKQKPPGGAYHDKNNLRQFKTRSGHTLTFDDVDDGNIEIKTKKGQVIMLDDKADKIEIKEQSGQNAITIEGASKNEITIKSGSTSQITLNNKGEIVIKGQKSIQIQGSQIQVKADATLDLEAAASINMKSNGMVNIKGSMVKIN